MSTQGVFFNPKGFCPKLKASKNSVAYVATKWLKKTFEISVPWELTIVLFGQIFDYVVTYFE